jgi:RIO kinase 1
MKAPPRLQPLVEEGLIDTVVRQLMSGKEAMVYVVRCGDDTRCAKIYKEATQRSFRQAVDYTENRKVKNSRQARAMAKGTQIWPPGPGGRLAKRRGRCPVPAGRCRCARAQPYNFHDGVLLMELVTDAHGDAAPRLNDLAFTPEAARTHHATLLREVVRMLCAGVVHGDLSEFNILLAHIELTENGGGTDVPVIIDLPQAVDLPRGNNHAQRMLLRDVANLRDFFGQRLSCALAHLVKPQPGVAGFQFRKVAMPQGAEEVGFDGRSLPERSVHGIISQAACRLLLRNAVLATTSGLPS